MNEYTLERRLFELARETGDTILISYANMLTHDLGHAENIVVQMARTFADNRRFCMETMERWHSQAIIPVFNVPLDSPVSVMRTVAFDEWGDVEKNIIRDSTNIHLRDFLRSLGKRWTRWWRV